MPRNMLITGGAGFIGSHLTEHLLEHGHNVTVIDDFSTGIAANLAAVRDNTAFQLVEGDIDTSPDMPELVGWSDSIFHLAAAVGVELVVRDPVRTIETNIHGTERLCTLASEGCKRLIFASTSEVYGRSRKIKFAEGDDFIIGPPTHFRWAYAASKGLDEFLLLAYHKEGRLRPTIVRLFNTVGPRQVGVYGMVLPRFVQAALDGDPLRVFGDGTQIRCFCHVSDVVRALTALEDNDAAIGHIYNVGSETPTSIVELAQRVIEITGSASEITFVPYAEAYEPGFEDMQRRVPDTARLHTLAGWAPQKSLDQAIAEIAETLRHA